jgi:hypothetical protein
MELSRQAEVDKWLDTQNQGLLEAEAAMRKVRFAEQMLDRILSDEGFIPPEGPQLYLIQGSKQD